MKVLVTGSEGFIGKRLVEALRKKGIKVREFDLKKGDSLLDAKRLAKKIKGIEAVVHLAAELDENSKTLFKTNVEGTEALLNTSAGEKVKRFIFLSTVGVMGELKKQANEMTKPNPVTRYEKSKALAEEKVEQFQELVPVTIIRSALVLGANSYWKSIILLAKKGFPLIGSGKNKFQLVYVDDLVEAIVFCLENKQTEGETFIVAEEKAVTLEEFYIHLRKLLGKKEKPIKIPVWLAKTISILYITICFLLNKKTLFRPAYIQRLQRERNYSINKIKEFGWKPMFNSLQALEKTIDELKLWN